MLAFAIGAQAPTTGDATGARIGRWIDGHPRLSIAIAVAVCVAVVGAIALLARAWGRQRRRNRRLRRHQEAVLARQLGILQRHVEELRGDVGQLAELQDHVVGQLQMIRAVMSPSDDEALSLAWTASTSASPEPSGWSATRRELVGSTPGSALPGATPTPATTAPMRPLAEIDLRAPARLVETGEPMLWATRQQPH